MNASVADDRSRGCDRQSPAAGHDQHNQQERERDRGGIHIRQTAVGKHHDRDGSHRDRIVVERRFQALRRDGEGTPPRPARLPIGREFTR